MSEIDPTAFDPSPAMAMLSEPADLSAFRLVLGLLHVEHEDAVRVAAYDGACVRHLSPEAARAWALDIERGDYSAELEPISAALRALARRVEEITFDVMCKRAARTASAGMLNHVPMQGRA